ncbi:unnamed protein product, partial [Gongylonema pulchrum]|uniref:Protein FAM98B n=1 Tax=Gongylonema pulchrum TaxID=637853 RepID=A0A183E1D9_9BILA
MGGARNDATGQNDIGAEIAAVGFKGFAPKKIDEVLKTEEYNEHFCKLVEWMCNEISALYGLDETVHAPTAPDNVEFFLLELSSVLSELECPVHALTLGPVMERFRSAENRTKLLHFLLDHLKCARLTALERLYNDAAGTQHKSEEVCHLEDTLRALDIGQLPANVTAGKVFADLSSMAEKRMTKCKQKPQPLLTASLTDTQWAKIAALNEKLIQEYGTRIQLLLKRLDVTIQSFTWSDRIVKMQVRECAFS